MKDLETLRFLSPAEFADRIGKEPKTVIRMCQRGVIPFDCWSIRSHRYYIREDALLSFLPDTKVAGQARDRIRQECRILRKRLGLS
ncbi:MAG: helix-turn-helix domain-containing protein [Planctomycetaceae bacterium]|nr:helix-turn-helix domain-containing protein [Planctomycetaceae bacterium]